MPKFIRTTSTSPRTTKYEEIVLRPGYKSRLVFVVYGVENEKNPAAGVDGEFVFQKRSGSSTWIPIKTFKLSELKAGEGYTLRLKAAELLTLYERLKAAFALREQRGIPKGEKLFIEAQSSDFGKSADTEFIGTEEAQSLLTRAFKLLTTANTADAIQRLVELNPDVLPNLNALIGLSSLKETLTFWENNQNNGDEDDWQKFLEDRAYVLSQVLSFPLVIIGNKPYLGGKGTDNKGGKYADFLAANTLTRSAVIVEIKTPMTPLLCGEYRDDVYPFSEELSGAIAQVLYQRRTFLGNHSALYKESARETSPAGICCVVVAGNIGRQLSDGTLKENFEMQRQSLHGVTVLTYDELFRKIEDLIGLIESPTT